MAEQIDLPDSGKLLDRDLSLAITAEVRRVAGPVLREVVDQGLAVFQRCSATAKGKDEQIGVLFPFMHVVEMLDGVEVLLAAAAVAPAQVVLRAAFEAFLTVEHVTERESERRAAAYVVADIHKRIHGLERLDLKTPRGKQFAASMAKDKHGANVSIPNLEDRSESRDGYHKLLEEPHLSEANEEYERTRARLKKHPPFHALWNGPQSLEQLATVLGRPGEYDLMYRQWSNTAHGTDLQRQLRGADGQPAIERVRNGEGLVTTYLHSLTMGLNAIHQLLSHYRPDELKTLYEHWYAEKIRPVYIRLAPSSDDPTRQS